MSAARGASVGVDVGGTFTDLAEVSADGHVVTGKVLSTPADQSDGVERALGELASPAAAIERLSHGTTVVTNMLLERSGARVVLCATAGATDLLELRRQERASLYDLAAHHPPPLVPHERVIPVDERIEPGGTVRALDEAAGDAAAKAAASHGPEIVAVCLLHAYADASHERLLGEHLRTRLPGIDVVLSSDVLPEIREYERTATVACEAYTRPGVSRYLRRLSERLAAGGYPPLRVMASSGGTADARMAGRASASLALSGPAGGVTGAAIIARAAGVNRALSIDIGGTSADVGLILDGEPLVEPGGVVAGVPIALPRVLVETVSAGGGSIAWIDDGGALRVGPRSAGAVPGPVAFGRGGTAPTVTDAHVALGNIHAAQLGEVRIDAGAAVNVVAALADRLGVTVERVSAAIIASADAAMARALRRLSVERGIDPRHCVLIAFGGGGPLHACGLADGLGMTRVLVPPHAGVLSALGLALAPDRRVSLASVMREASTLDAGARRELCAALDDHVGAVGGQGALVARARYRGQGHELDVPWEEDVDGVELSRRFADVHHHRYGFRLDRPVDLVSARLTRTSAARTVELRRRGASSWDAATRHDDGGAFDATVRGRATIVLADSTLLVPAGWTARTLDIGGWMVERTA